MNRLLNIAQIGDPVLREPTAELTPQMLADPEMQQFIDDLIATMRAAKGAGLAANQVHQSLRICAIEVRDNPRYPYRPNIPLTILVNPVLTPVGEDMFENYEGCLSVPNLRGMVHRHSVIDVNAMDRNGAPIQTRVKGMTAATYQHEVDHLDGLLFLDRVGNSRSLVTWENFERYHLQQVAENVGKVVAQYGS